MSENVEDHFYILKRMVGYVSQKCDICSRNAPILKVMQNHSKWNPKNMKHDFFVRSQLINIANK